MSTNLRTSPSGPDIEGTVPGQVLTWDGSQWIAAAVPPSPPLAHAPTHRPVTGTDPLVTAPALGIGGGNAEGVSDDFARSDHNHTITETGGPTDLTVGMIPAGTFLARVGGSIVGVAPPGLATDSQSVPQPITPATGQSTRALPLTFDGGAYRIQARTLLSTIIGRKTGIAAGTIRVAIYQVPGGLLAGVAALLATGTAAPGVGASNYAIPVAPVMVEAGIVFILCGRVAAVPGFTSRAYTTPTINLLSSAPAAGTVPVKFTTAIPSTVAPPAVFDPSVSGVVSAVNLLPVVRMA